VVWHSATPLHQFEHSESPRYPPSHTDRKPPPLLRATCFEDSIGTVLVREDVWESADRLNM
jgi:hypothetical protein